MQDNTFDILNPDNGPMISDHEDAFNYEQGVKYQSQLRKALDQILDSDGLNDLEQELDDKEADERLDGMWERSL